MTSNGAAGFSTLEEVVASSFPAQHVRLIAVRADGDVAYALFDTRPAGPSYLYGVNYERTNGRWKETSSSNGNGWSRVGGESHGTQTLWDEDAPPGADAVRATFRGSVSEEPVLNGVYLFVWWRVPETRDDGADVELEGNWPEVVSFRVDGVWIGADAMR